MSIPAEMPADVITLPCSTTCDAESTVMFGKSSCINPSERQCVVARNPSSNPALPSIKEPVHTEVSVSTCAARSTTNESTASFFISLRVPQPPGTTKISRGGQLSNVALGKTFIPPVVITGLSNCATNMTSNGEGSSRRRSSFSRVAENTSKGPQKSRTSISSKTMMPIHLRSIGLPQI